MKTVRSPGGRRERIARAWDLDDAVVLVGAGGRVPIPGSDRFHRFHAHPAYRWLAGDGLPDRVLAFDPREGWTLFAPRPTVEERVWEPATPEEGRPRAELEAWLAGRAGRPCALLGVPVPGVEGDAGLAAALGRAVDAARRVKDPDELDRMRRAAACTAAGFAAARAVAAEGVDERRIAVELEHGFRRAGGDGPAFDTIVASGPNAAVLHFEPGDRALRRGELLLVDAGAASGGYASDVTRTWAPAGDPSPRARDLHAVVLEAQQEAVRGCTAGTEFRALHLETATRLARGLVDLGLLRGDPAGLVERDAHALFFPHGLGHLLGLETHDAGGYAEGRTPSDRFGLRSLRADLPLEPGMVVTIEPGLYLIEALLRDPAVRERHRDAVDWERADAWIGLGGVRIEDDVLVTGGRPEILTNAIPRGMSA